jgi:hypothetical protein
MAGSEGYEDSEFGGGPGAIQPAAKGHTPMTARENRTVQTVRSHRTAPLVFGELPETDLHYDSYREIVDGLEVRTWGRDETEQPPDRLA